MSESIFRSYDIRGIYGKDLHEDVASKIAQAFAMRTEGPVAVAHDIRSSSPSLYRAFIAGLLSFGKSVVGLGSLPLGAAVFSAWQRNLEAAYVTASHLGPEWNGIKFFHSSGIGFMEYENFAIRDIFRTLSSAESESALRNRGELKEIPAAYTVQDYCTYLSAKVKPARQMKVVIDCGNGAGCLIAPLLFQRSGFDVVLLFGNPDGTFPNRTPDPFEADLSELRKKVLEIGADAGIAYDGDGDRMILMDDLGNILTPGQTSHFLLSDLLQKQKGPVVANVECTRAIDDVAIQHGCEIIRVPVGHTYLMDAVHTKSAVFGVETSGHYALPSLVPFDDAMAISYYALCLLSARREKLSTIVSSIPVYPYERINFPSPDNRKFAIVDELKSELQKLYQKVSTMDGIRVDIDDGWVLIRASNTEPKIRLTVEAKELTTFNRLKEEFSAILRSKL